MKNKLIKISNLKVFGQPNTTFIYLPLIGVMELHRQAPPRSAATTPIYAASGASELVSLGAVVPFLVCLVNLKVFGKVHLFKNFHPLWFDFGSDLLIPAMLVFVLRLRRRLFGFLICG